MHIKKHLALVATLLLFVSCTYYTVLSDDVKTLRIENGETFLYVQNQFQFFLRDATVWNLSDFTSNTPQERHKLRRYTVSKRISTEKGVLERYVITTMENGKPAFRYVLQKSEPSPENMPGVAFIFQLETDKGKVLMTMAKDVKENDPLGFRVQIGETECRLNGKTGIPGRQYGAVLTSELSDNNNEALFCFKKSIEYFSDRAEFDILRLNNPVDDDAVYVAVSAVCDSVIHQMAGGYRK